MRKDSDLFGNNSFRISCEARGENIHFFAMVTAEELVDAKFSTQMKEKDFICYVASEDVAESLARRFDDTQKELNENIKFWGNLLLFHTC